MSISYLGKLLFMVMFQILVHGPNAHLIIGTEASPFTHHVTLTLTGRREDDPLVLARSIIVGSKAIGIFGNVRNSLRDLCSLIVSTI